MIEGQAPTGGRGLPPAQFPEAQNERWLGSGPRVRTGPVVTGPAASSARRAIERAIAALSEPGIGATLIAIFVLLLYRDRPWNEFQHLDELDILGHALEFSTLEILFSPLKYQTLSEGNFTPLLSLTMKLDTVLFGLWLPGYWVHTLVSIVAAMVSFYLLLRRLSVPGITALAATFFLVTTPVVEDWAGGLHVRHYLEGFTFAIVALFAGMRGLEMGGRERETREQKWLPWMLAASLAYLIACLHKEIYALVPFLILAAPMDRPSRAAIGERLLRTLPMLGTFIVYFAWRAHMLSGFGGYDPNAGMARLAPGEGAPRTGLISSLFESARTALAQGTRAVGAVLSQSEVGWGGQHAALVLVLFSLGAAALLLRRRQLPLLIIAVYLGFSAFLLVFLELVITGFGVTPRWITLPVAGLIAFVAWSSARVGRWTAWLATVALAALAFEQAPEIPRSGSNIFPSATAGALDFARRSEPGDLLYFQANDPYSIRHFSGVGVKSALIQGRHSGIASTGPIVNDVLELSDRACHIILDSRAEAAAGEKCFDRKPVHRLSANESIDSLSAWTRQLTFLPAQETTIAQSARMEDLHLVIYDGDYYVHSLVGWVFPAVISRAYMLRSWVEPERAWVTVGIETENGYVITAPMPLFALAEMELGRTEHDERIAG